MFKKLLSYVRYSQEIILTLIYDEAMNNFMKGKKGK